MEVKEDDNELKDSINELNKIKIQINLNEEKYLLHIYPSEDKSAIIFRLEKEKIQTYYYFEYFELRDFRQKNKLFISDDSIPELFSHFKEIRKNCIINLEKKNMKMNICFESNTDSKFILNFILKKETVSQKKLNPLLIEQIQENKSKIKMLKKQVAKLNKSIQIKTDLINEFKNNIANMNSAINSINEANNTNKIKNEEKETINNDNNKNDNIKKDEEEEELISKDNSSNQEEKRYISNNRKKKNKKQNKKNKYIHNLDNSAINNNTNKDDYIFCFESMEILGNKKFFEILIIFNIVSILIILCLLGSIYSIRSDLEYEKIIEEDFINKLSYLNIGNDNNDDQYNIFKNKNNENIRTDYKNQLFDTENQELYFKKEIIKKGDGDEDNEIIDVKFILKYSSAKEPQGFGKFYQNCKGIKENIIFLKNSRGKRFALFSRDIYEVLHGLVSRDSVELHDDFVLYSLNINDILEYSFKNIYDIYNAFVYSISKFLSNEDKSSQYKFDTSNKGKFPGQQLLGNIVEFEIYEVLFIK